MIFDTHCHLGFAKDDAVDLHSRAREAGVSLMVDVGIDLDSSRQARDRARSLDGVHWTAGLHPNSANEFEQEWNGIAELCRQRDCLAVGETGLDFYRDRAAPERQVAAFEAHLALARELDRPVVIHCRDAFSRTFEVLGLHAPLRGVMHCFAGGVDEARRALELGLHLSFAGPLTYPRAQALREAAAYAPDDRLMVETDAPFLPPQDRRGQPNEPAYVVATLRQLAELRGWSFADAARITTENGRRLFAIPRVSFSG